VVARSGEETVQRVRRSGAQQAPDNQPQGTPAIVMLDVAEYERLRRLERAQAPSFVDVLLTLPRDDSGQPRTAAKARDLDF
jgi:hypothetical protein